MQYGLSSSLKVGEIMNHYFENNTNLKSNKKINKVLINNQEFTFLSDNGVFSKKGLDFGTRTLISSLDVSKIQGDVLDFGCGYGPIGIFISKNTNASVDMIDINERSLGLARENLKLNSCIADVFKSNIYENVTKKYDYIISNPPIRVGKEILYKILFESFDHLKDGGQLWIVINKDQGAKSVLRDLSSKYNTNVVLKNKGFYVICSQK